MRFVTKDTPIHNIDFARLQIVDCLTIDKNEDIRISVPVLNGLVEHETLAKGGRNVRNKLTNHLRITDFV